MNNILKTFRQLVPEIIAEKLRKANYNLHTKGKVARILKEKSKVYLEIGAGKKMGENEWVTLDINKDCDLFWDLRYGIPFPDKSVEMIYSSHLFEHLTFQQTAALLKECKRVLVPGGVFSICVPNARLYLEAYVKRDKEFWTSKPSYWEPGFNNTTIIDYVNYVAYMDWEHKYMFDEENLIYILTMNGFKDAKLRDFDSALDLPDRQHESIYVSAIS
ncbi:MAG TPA: methyltransferase domain-containing protein [Puia sp.]|nr:methyltransferase domain-containing protein [Puia sp.]